MRNTKKPGILQGSFALRKSVGWDGFDRKTKDRTLETQKSSKINDTLNFTQKPLRNINNLVSSFQ
jgi:hypothetical protein